jgi:A/G-specific adenine glycosylase
VPNDVAALLELPGVGPYTAAAVASIAYGVPVAAIDTNARRVLARVDLGRDPDGLPAASIAAAAGHWLSRDRPGDWNQAVMDLGREVCRPVPRCDACPLSPACRFRVAGRRADGAGRARSQPAFEGSVRQLRGAVVRELRSRPRAATVAALARAAGEPEPRTDAAVDALVRDGVVERTRTGRVRLPR